MRNKEGYNDPTAGAAIAAVRREEKRRKRKEQKAMLNITEKYKGMIESFECDFTLAADPEDEHGLDDLQRKIEDGDERLLKDIELLKELSLKIRCGQIKIVEFKNRKEAERV